MTEDDDWTSGIHLSEPVRLLRIKAHETFDPIWRTGLVSRGRAYRLLARELGVPEPQAHFKQMSAKLLERAIPAAQRLRRRLERQQRG